MALQKKNYGSTHERIPSVSFHGVEYSPTQVLGNLSSPLKVISDNIYSINSYTVTFQQAVITVGSQKDTQSFREHTQSNLRKANQVVTETKEDLFKLSSIVKKGDKHQKLQVEKLRNTFKETVQLYSDTQKQLVEKMKLHFLPSEVARRDDEEASFRLSEGAAGGNEIISVDLSQETKALEFEQGLLLERELRIKEIESCVIDVNQIMKELASMVYKQGEDITSIENAIEDVRSNVESANTELEKASAYQVKRRKTTCLLLGFSVVIGIILAIIIAASLRNFR